MRETSMDLAEPEAAKSSAGAEPMSFRRPRRRPLRTRSGLDVVTWLTLFLIVLLGIPSRLVIGPLGSAGALSMVMGLASLGIWVVLAVTRNELQGQPRAPLRWALSAFVFAVAASYALAMAQPILSDEISPADVAIISLASWSGTMLLTMDGIASFKRLETFVLRFVVCGGLMALLGLAQFAFRAAIVDRVTIPGLTSLSDAGIYIRNGLVRPAGNAIHPIEYGALLTIILPLALHVGIQRRDIPVALRWIPAASIAAVIAVSSSRSAYLGAAAAIAVCMFAWTREVRRRFLLVAVSGLALMSVAMPRLMRSTFNLFAGADEDPSISSRTDSFDFAWSFFADSPLLGRGIGTFLPKYRIFDNQYLGLLVSVGIIGTLALLALAIVAVVEMSRVYRTTSLRSTADLAVCLIASVVAGFLSLAFFDAFAFPMTMGALFLTLGIAGALARFSRTESSPLWG